MIETYQAIRKLLDEQLNGNTSGIKFDVSLFNSDEINYETSENGITYKTIPAHIINIDGDFLNVPNTSTLSATIDVELDMFVGDVDKLPVDEQYRWETVDYIPAIEILNDFRAANLAKVVPLGDTYLRMGGEDSTVLFQTTTEYDYNTIYFEVDIFNTDAETLLFAYADGDTQDEVMLLAKDDSNITLTYFQDYSTQLPIQVFSISIPYTIGLNKLLIARNIATPNTVYFTNGTNEQVAETDFTNLNFGDVIIGRTTGFEGNIIELIMTESQISSIDVTSIYASASTFFSNPTFRLGYVDRYTVKDLQGNAFVTDKDKINNCILIGSEGQMSIGFNSIIPMTDIRWFDEGKPRQMFSLAMDVVISKDMLFGNNFEYFLTVDSKEEQIYPLDRQHSFAGETSGVQYINGTYGVNTIEENMKGLTLSFLYKPTKIINKLVKHLTSNTLYQNEEYTLKIKYPFHEEEYDLLIDKGGISTNMNEISVFTLELKQRDGRLG
jgi:hypothetical protein